MQISSGFSKRQRCAIKAAGISAIVLVPTALSIVAEGAESLIHDHPWSAAGFAIIVYLFAAFAGAVWEGLILEALTSPSKERNTGLIGNFSDKVTDTAISLLHRGDRKQ